MMNEETLSWALQERYDRTLGSLTSDKPSSTTVALPPVFAAGPASADDQWVRCDDRLPDENIPVLVTVQGLVTRYVLILQLVDDDWWFEKWETPSYFGRFNTTNNQIIAWRPLPAAYQEGE